MRCPWTSTWCARSGTPSRAGSTPRATGCRPHPAWDELQRRTRGWRHGSDELGAVGRVDRAGARGVRRAWSACRRAEVAVGGTVSELLGLVAASLPDGARVVVPEVEFTSNLFPWLVQQDRGVEVVTVPADRLRRRDRRRAPTVVAISLVQSSTGEVADLDDVVAAARAVDALVVVDATPGRRLAAGRRQRRSTRSSARLQVADVAARLGVPGAVRPACRSGCGRSTPAGTPAPTCTRRTTGRRCGWPRRPPVRRLAGVVQLGRHRAGPRAASSRSASSDPGARRGAGRTGSGPASGCRPAAQRDRVDHRAGCAARRLERAGIRAATRAGALRASFHLYSTEADVDAALTRWSAEGPGHSAEWVSVCSCRDSRRSWRPWWRRGLRWVPRRRRVGPAWPAGWSAARSFRS